MQTPGAGLKFPGIGTFVSGLLAAAYSLTCLAYIWRFRHFSCKTFSFLWEENGYSEAFAGRVEWMMIGLLLISAICIWIKKVRWLALAGTGVMAAEMLAATLMLSAKYPALYWAEWMMRFTLPIAAILLFQPWEKSKVWSLRVMRIATALTFAAHGVKALMTDPQFTDFLLVLFRRMGTSGIGESQAATLLHVIGTIDILLAGHLLGFKLERNRMVLIWMAAWGAITAFSRITYGGWGNGHEVLIRTAHFAMPLALLLLARSKADQQPGSSSLS
jgi:hypothetical protein